MTTFRKLKPIIAASMPQPSMSLGERAELCLLPLESLVVDDRYQRTIGKQGRPNILRILAGFDWRKFAPVVVTPVGSGLYAIIDGQHRATAALMHPAIDMVPCMVIRVTPEDAAAVFAAINGQVTRITGMQIFKARVIAKEPFAVELKHVLDAAEVRVLPYKTPDIDYQKGDTLAIGTLEACFKRYGADVLRLALQCVVQTGNGNAGCLTAPMVSALCALIDSNTHKGWLIRPTDLFALVDELDLSELLLDAAGKSKRLRKPQSAILMEMVGGHLGVGAAPADAMGAAA